MLPVHESRLRWLLRAAACLCEAGAEPVHSLVLPNETYFPDRFDGSAEAVLGQLRRVLAHAGLADVSVELQLVTPEGELAGGCKSGGCSAPRLRAPSSERVARIDDRYVVVVSTGEVGHPTALMAGLVRATSRIFLIEAELEEEIHPLEREAFVDVTGALLGFGVLLANGSHITHKGCSGVTVMSVTKLPVDEVVVALAVACALFELPERAARSELDTEPRRRFEVATAWVEANRGVLELVRGERAAIDADRYSLAEAGTWLSRLFRGKARPGVTPTLDELESLARGIATSPVHREKAKRMASLREAIDEAFD